MIVFAGTYFTLALTVVLYLYLWYNQGEKKEKPQRSHLEEQIADRFFASWMVISGAALSFSVVEYLEKGVTVWVWTGGTYAVYHWMVLLLWWRQRIARVFAGRLWSVGCLILMTVTAYLSGIPFDYMWCYSPAVWVASFSVVSCGKIWGCLVLVFQILVSFGLQFFVPLNTVVLMDKQMFLEHAKWYPPLNAAFAVLFVVHVIYDVDVRVSVLHQLALSKDLFISTVSHEIRTPLNGIIGSVQMLEFELEDKLLNADFKEIKESVRSAKYSSLLLNMLVNNVMTKNENHVVIQSVNAKTFTDALRAVSRGLASFKAQLAVEILLNENVPKTLFLDAQRLFQCCLNMIGNAVKFQETGRIVTTFNCLEGKLRVEVIDNGSGLSKEFARNRLFQSFERDKKSLHVSGSGLGLSICKKLVEEMQGQIGHRPNKEKGSIFWLEVPLYERSENVWQFGQSKWCGLSTPEWQKPIFLNKTSNEIHFGSNDDVVCVIVDDVVVNQIVLKGFLKRLGCKSPIIFDNGASALQWLLEEAKSGSNRKPFILLDIFMPVMDGPTTAEFWRGIEQRLQRPKSFLCSVSAQEEFDNRNMDAHLSKPILFDELKVIFEKCINR